MQMPMRKDVPVEETWDLSLIYPTREALESDIELSVQLADEIVSEFKGKITDAKSAVACLDKYRRVVEIINKYGNYAELAASVDFYDNEAQQLSNRVGNLFSAKFSELSFIDSELGELSEEILTEASDLSPENRGYIRKVMRAKPHRLSAETEKALAALSGAIGTPYQIYNMAKLADMKFSSFTVNGKEYPLGYALFENDYEYDKDTALRRGALKAFSDKLREYENVTAAAYNANVTNDKALASLRGYDSVFDYLLAEQRVTREMYDRQIDIIMEKLAPHMRRYAKLLQKVHKLDKMTTADLKLGIDPDFVSKLGITEAREIIEKGLAVMGEDYVSMIREAFDKRWLDCALNQGKSTGGFCASPYGCGSFILLNLTGRMADVFTMAHELGHAGHFRHCGSKQSIFDTEVSSYFVESPSTINELILAHYLLKTNDDKRFRRWVIGCIVGRTYFHDFVTHLLEAAYQREVYRIIDAGGSVQAETLSRLYRETLEKFWGEDVEIAEGSELTWMRQPHYYMGLYSYTYSAGLTIATEVCKRMETEGQSAVDDWLRVLDAGSSKKPVDLAAMAGVDITTSAPLEDAIATVGAYVDEMWKLTEEINA